MPASHRDRDSFEDGTAPAGSWQVSSSKDENTEGPTAGGWESIEGADWRWPEPDSAQPNGSGYSAGSDAAGSPAPTSTGTPTTPSAPSDDTPSWVNDPIPLPGGTSTPAESAFPTRSTSPSFTGAGDDLAAWPTYSSESTYGAGGFAGSDRDSPAGGGAGDLPPGSVMPLGPPPDQIPVVPGEPGRAGHARSDEWPSESFRSVTYDRLAAGAASYEPPARDPASSGYDWPSYEPADAPTYLDEATGAGSAAATHPAYDAGGYGSGGYPSSPYGPSGYTTQDWGAPAGSPGYDWRAGPTFDSAPPAGPAPTPGAPAAPPDAGAPGAQPGPQPDAPGWGVPAPGVQGQGVQGQGVQGQGVQGQGVPAAASPPPAAPMPAPQAAAPSAPAPAPAQGVGRAGPGGPAAPLQPAVQPGQPPQQDGQAPPRPGRRSRGRHAALPPSKRPETSRDLTVDQLVAPKKAGPRSGWRRALYSASGGRIDLGESTIEQYRSDLIARVRAPSPSCHRVAVISLKGGVGKTTISTSIGATLAAYRGDRIVAVDANPDRGTLSDKVSLQTDATVRDLLNVVEPLLRYSDVRRFTSQSPDRLEILASERDPAVSDEFSETDYRRVAAVLERFYNIVITDCGTGLVHSTMAGVLDLADQLVVVSSAAYDGAKSASATLDWLEAHGHGHLVHDAVAVVNSSRPGAGGMALARLEQHFASRCRAVTRIPFDPVLETGADIVLERLDTQTKDALLELAAAVTDGVKTERQPHPAP